MNLRFTSALIAVAIFSAAWTVHADETVHVSDDPRDQPMAAGCFAESGFKELWTKVIQRRCLTCHQADGDAADTNFLLVDEMKLRPYQQADALIQNRETLHRLATRRTAEDGPLLLLKPRGELDHGGGEVLPADSVEFRLLREYVESLANSPQPNKALADERVPEVEDPECFFEDVRMVSDQRLLRRVALSLAARLPSEAERNAVRDGGLEAMPAILDAMLNEDAFYERLVEGFNDILLTLGYTGSGVDALAYDHFENSRLWYQTHSLDHLPEHEREKARYRLSDQYQEALRREPLELLRFIVRNDRPFTEILTADYTMVSPYTARGYGVFETLADEFDDPDDPFEYIQTKIPALTSRNGRVQPSEDGLYPHSGLLTMFQYLRRYPTTETNRNRLRARMYYQHFLGVDIMKLAPRVGDAAAVEAAWKNPTMQAPECVVCHRTIDPIAGLFQDYYNEEGHYGPRRDGWFEDMFPPGREGTPLPESEQIQALRWLGRETVSDPRFATAMAEHVFYILTGRRLLSPPEDIEDPFFTQRRRAYAVQRMLLEQAAARFVVEDYNLKVIFQDLVVSSWYRAEVPETVDNEARLAELDDVGLVRMLGPEQLERQIIAVFGRPWGRLNDGYEILYGGIDSREVTERLADPSGAVGSLQRIMANQVACQNVAADFALPAQERRLFPGIEPDVVVGGDNPQVEQKIRAAIVHLHHHLLGREDALDDPEVDRTLNLLANIVADATSREHFEKTESYFCKSTPEEGPRDPDPHYMIRGWRAVVTYLLRQNEFLYE
ncbi:MAG: DUF1592 domain-containing protein [Pirellulaceae bacterium]|nr:DUF1592 domain-containing protein [Pirellulaceae bacterium]